MTVSITTRAGKGAPINMSEHDINLSNIKSAIEYFQLNIDTLTNNVSSGYLAYIDSNGNAAKANATSASTPAVGLVIISGDASTGTLQNVGRHPAVYIETGITITKGNILYLSKTSIGTVTNVKPAVGGNIQQVIGIAKANGTGVGGTVDTVFNINMDYATA